MTGYGRLAAARDASEKAWEEYQAAVAGVQAAQLKMIEAETEHQAAEREYGRAAAEFKGGAR